MKETFDFEKIGKKMPYRVPENFLDTIEKNVLSSVAKTNIVQLSTNKRNKRRMWFYLTTGAAAAIVLLLLTVHIFVSKEAIQDYSLEQVEMAFNQLTPEDQDFLMEVYDEDVFLEED